VPEVLMTTREVAARLRLSPETVLRYWRAGELPGFRLRSNVLRFEETDVAAFLAASRREVIPQPPCRALAGAVGSPAPPSTEETS
jgi:excisionase family DNA binding protein